MRQTKKLASGLVKVSVAAATTAATAAIKSDLKDGKGVLQQEPRAPPRPIKAADSYSHREPNTAMGVKSQYYYVRARDNDLYRQSGYNIMVCPGYQAKCSQNL